MTVSTVPTATTIPISLKSRLNDLNKVHAVVQVDGKTLVLKEFYDTVMQRTAIQYSTVQDIKTFYSNERWELSRTNKEPTTAYLGDEWINWESRRQYDRVVFDPSNSVPKNIYNLWRGFAVTPKPGNWSKFKAHLLANICNGNEEHFTYLLAWMAQGIQHPDVMPETAIICKSTEKGTGKSIFARYYRKLFGQHGNTLSNPLHLMGRFNDHLEDTICLVLEEAFFTGVKSHESNLKSYITEPTICIEGKGLGLKTVRNYLRLIILSNEEWVIPATSDERRFLVLDVNPQHKQDTKYFRRIVDEMDNGGLEAMLYDLERLDYSSIDIRTVPKTESLGVQKILSLPTTHKWWMEKLIEGCLLPSHLTWTEVEKDELTADFLAYVKTYRRARDNRSGSTELGMFLKTILDGKLETYRPSKSDGTRPRTWAFPPLEECREMFDAYLGAPYDWPTPETRDKKPLKFHLSKG